jgi:hypothetical protein
LPESASAGGTKAKKSITAKAAVSAAARFVGRVMKDVLIVFLM